MDTDNKLKVENSQFDELYYKEMRSDRRNDEIKKKLSIINVWLAFIVISLIALVITQIPTFIMEYEKLGSFARFR